MEPLAPDEVRVFVVRVPPGEPRSDALDDGERQRAAGFRRAEDRRRFVAARQALREILAQHAGGAPADVAFAMRCARCGSARHGKPALARPAGTDLRFSATRSGDVALVAVARGRALGVDVERVDARVDHREIAARFFARGERDGLDLAGFYEAWTRKEALLKLSGLGLAGDLAAPPPPGAWVERIMVPDGYAGAVAGEGAPPRLVTRPWPS
nr:4'-phosphopantetheinyl transferase [uncultured bacterium]